jgi:hypothetical protein
LLKQKVDNPRDLKSDLKKMEKKKSNEWIFFIIAWFILFIALITPAVSFSNSAGSIDIYLSGILSVYIYRYGSVSVAIENPEITSISALAESALVISLFTVLILSLYLRRDIANFKALRIRYYLLINAILLIIPTIMWIVRFGSALSVLPQELIDLGYHNIWEIFTPSFGLIGIFSASGLILVLTFYIQFRYQKILEKLLPTKADKIRELNSISQKLVIEMDQMINAAKQRYIEAIDSPSILNKAEQRKFDRLSRIVNTIHRALSSESENNPYV